MTLESLQVQVPSGLPSSVGQGDLPGVGQSPEQGVNVNALGQGSFDSRESLQSRGLDAGLGSNEDGLEGLQDPTKPLTPSGQEMTQEEQDFLGGRFKSKAELEKYVMEMELQNLERNQSMLNNKGYQPASALGASPETLQQLDAFVQSTGGVAKDFNEAYQIYQDGLKYRAGQSLNSYQETVTKTQETMRGILKAEFGAEYDTYMPEIQRRIETTNPEKNSLQGARELMALIKYDEYRTGKSVTGAPTQTPTKVPGARTVSNEGPQKTMLSEKAIYALYDSNRDEYIRLKDEINKAYSEGRVQRDMSK
jgi:hypothetical protein